MRKDGLWESCLGILMLPLAIQVAMCRGATVYFLDSVWSCTESISYPLNSQSTWLSRTPKEWSCQQLGRSWGGREAFCWSSLEHGGFSLRRYTLGCIRYEYLASFNCCFPYEARNCYKVHTWETRQCCGQMDSRQRGAGGKPKRKEMESCQYPQGLRLAGGRNSVPSSQKPKQTLRDKCNGRS